MKYPQIYTGKVRNIYDVGNGYLLMEASNRISSFDRHLGEITSKGLLLNKMSEFWFNKTQHIIANHLLWSCNKFSFVKKCNPFKVEVVVRGYITGSTSTSIWTYYKDGCREYCGNILPDGLVKNQKLSKPLITPTTKSEIHDKPVTPQEILDMKLMTKPELEYVYEKALQLFKFGQEYADSIGLILVDTKYEFGRDVNGNGDIILIDEVHTCDSSRYWIADSYQSRFDAGEEPEKLDKDNMRDWIKKYCNPYKTNNDLPELSQDIITKVSNGYFEFYKRLIKQPDINISDIDNFYEMAIKKIFILNINNLTEYFYENYAPQVAVILYGSNKDDAHVNKLTNELEQCNIYAIRHQASAHKQTHKLLHILDKYNKQKVEFRRKIVFICVAGRSNALGGVVAGNTNYPVIACPPFTDKIDMMTNINSTLQCPSNVPVLTMLEPCNVALSVKNIFSL